MFFFYSCFLSFCIGPFSVLYYQSSWAIQFYREIFFDEEGNLLDEKPKDPMEVAMRKKISESRNKFEDLIQMAKNFEQGMDFYILFYPT